MGRQVEVEWACVRCGCEFSSEGTWVQAGPDPYDLDFTPDPVCPQCAQSRAVYLAEDVNRCGVCGRPNDVGEVCRDCAEEHGGAFAGTDEQEQRQALRWEHLEP